MFLFDQFQKVDTPFPIIPVSFFLQSRLPGYDNYHQPPQRGELALRVWAFGLGWDCWNNMEWIMDCCTRVVFCLMVWTRIL